MLIKERGRGKRGREGTEEEGKEGGRGEEEERTEGRERWRERSVCGESLPCASCEL